MFNLIILLPVITTGTVGIIYMALPIILLLTIIITPPIIVTIGGVTVTIINQYDIMPTIL